MASGYHSYIQAWHIGSSQPHGELFSWDLDSEVNNHEDCIIILL